MEIKTEIIRGICPSKSNMYRVAENRLVKTDVLRGYESSFFIQCRHYRNVRIDGYFELHVKIFYPNQLRDLDNGLKIILDCLQNAKIIKNDNKCVKIVAEKYLDVKDPRIEFSLTLAQNGV